MNTLSKIKDNPLLSFLIFLLVLAFGAFVGVLFFEYVETYISELLGLSNKNGALKFLGIGMGGVLVALQALMSYKRAKAMEDTAKAQTDAVLKTEEGQRQDRLKNAIEHLGHESDSVRLGGAYELFHLAQDTEQLRQTVLDILCAHIRRTTGESKYRETHKSKPSEEVQSLLTLLFVQEDDVFKSLRADLRGSWMKGARLWETCLENAVLAEVNLQKAELYRAQLKNAILIEAQLQGADFTEAQLQGAYLRRARMQGAVLLGTQLQCADLTRARMQGAVLLGTQLQEADLSKAELQGLMGGGEIYPYPSFEERIRNQIDRKSNLVGMIFEGSLSQEELDFIVADFSDAEDRKKIRNKLMRHVGKPASYGLPENSGAITGSYTKEDAEEWIAEYEKAMSEIPGDDS